MVVFGTRPEAIKMAPVVRALKEHAAITTAVCVSGQHREMLDQVLSAFQIEPEFDINAMTEEQRLSSMSAKILLGMTDVLEQYKPSMIIVHGDTTTSYISSLAAFYLKIPIAHVEAGLRTHNMYSPWPEEFNRRSIGTMATLHFAPTQEAEANLLAEGTPATNVEVTGNTVIDAIRLTRTRLDTDFDFFNVASNRLRDATSGLPIVLVTAHRRENLAGGIEDICRAVHDLAALDNCQFVFPMHKNPSVRNTVIGMLSTCKNVLLTEPLDYPEMVALMSRSRLLLTDSGGIQEEAAALRIPCLVMRDTTERPELVAAGGARLVGTNRHVIVDAVQHILGSSEDYRAMQIEHNPYGDGFAAGRIAARVVDFVSTIPPIPEYQTGYA